MATRIILVDDLDGGDADETVTFGWRGRQYEIDLNAANAEKLGEILVGYIEAGRPANARAKRAYSKQGDASLTKRQRAAIRTWAVGQGHEVGDRGRISAGLIAMYRAAHG
jgi:hypothetical protein